MTDDQIVALYWQKDEAALRESELKYGRYCRTLAERILRNAEDAAECVNDVYMRAWESIPPQRPQYLRAFLAKLTRNLAIDRFRAHTAGKRGGGETDAVLDELAEIIGSQDTAESTVTANELGAAVSRFLYSQPRREADVFVRRCFFADSPGEIAKRYGLSEGNVRVILSRTRRKLRAYLESEEYL